MTAIQYPHRCQCHSSSPVYLTLRLALTCEQDPEILEPHHLGQELVTVAECHHLQT